MRLAPRVQSAANNPGPVMALGLGLRSASQFVLLVLFTRLSGQEVAAEFVLSVAILAPALPLCDMGLRTVLVLDEADIPLGPPVRLRLAAYAILLATLVFVVGPLVDLDKDILLSIFVLKCLDAFADLYHALLQRSHRMLLVGWLIAGNAVLSSILAILLAAGVGVALYGLYASVFTSAVFLWIARSSARGIGATTIDSPQNDLGTGVYRYLLRLGLPMGAGIALTGLASAFPQYVLATTSTPEGLTTFAYLTFVVIAVDLLINGLTQASLRKFADVRSTGAGVGLLRHLSHRSLRMSMIVTLGSLVSLPLISWGIRWATGDKIEISLVECLLVVAVIAFLPYAFLMPYGLNALKKSTDVFVSNSLGAIVLLLASLSLIPFYGVLGALVAMLSATCVRSSSAFLMLRRACVKDG